MHDHIEIKSTFIDYVGTIKANASFPACQCGWISIIINEFSFKEFLMGEFAMGVIASLVAAAIQSQVDMNSVSSTYSTMA
ncbi:MAG: hypothetical protein ACI8WB_004974 [Phenylobacterium sp.]